MSKKYTIVAALLPSPFLPTNNHLMLDPANDMLPPPSSPSDSSLSSSDLDTESTGSFFHDGSTTLGTLMGVTLQAITFRAASQRENSSISAAAVGRRSRRPEKVRGGGVAARQRRRWWMLCGEEGDAARRASLGEYLEVERRFGDGSVAVELEEGIVLGQPRNGRALFAEGRVLPPAEVVEESSPAAPSGMCRFSAVDRWCNMCSVCLGQ
ncbi:uncharacterized protein At3g17950 [Henckelia pumila]|uniref:uncharacterized protein At3g17950 n=1 Tax=Henckelia pumila TaxID=405737 RepID=UPI003C6DDB15